MTILACRLHLRGPNQIVFRSGPWSQKRTPWKGEIRGWNPSWNAFTYLSFTSGATDQRFRLSRNYFRSLLLIFLPAIARFYIGLVYGTSRFTFLTTFRPIAITDAKWLHSSVVRDWRGDIRAVAAWYSHYTTLRHTHSPVVGWPPPAVSRARPSIVSYRRKLTCVTHTCIRCIARLLRCFIIRFRRRKKNQRCRQIGNAAQTRNRCLARKNYKKCWVSSNFLTLKK